MARTGGPGATPRAGASIFLLAGYLHPLALPADENRMSERRATQRVRTIKGGSILFGVVPAIDCIVRNVSETGACLEVASPIGIPDEFTLLIKPELRKRDCKVAWRSISRIGVCFTQRPTSDKRNNG